MDDDCAADLPLLDPPPAELDIPDVSVAGVLLAAGTASRFGDSNKLLAMLDGEPVVRHAGRTLAGADLVRRVAVLGPEAGAIRDALAGLGFQYAHNQQYAEGQATSLRAGIKAVRSADAAVFALGDMPLVSPESVELLIRAYARHSLTAAAAAYEGQRGNPVLFDRTLFPELRSVSGDTGGREVFLNGDRSALVETNDPGVRCDVDTRDDLRRLRSR